MESFWDGNPRADLPEAKALEERLNTLLQDQCKASLRGYDLVARLYDAEWERLFHEYLAILFKASLARNLGLPDGR